MDDLRAIYPTEEQIKEAFEAHSKGPEFLKAVLRKRREEREAAEKQPKSIARAVSLKPQI